MCKSAQRAQTSPYMFQLHSLHSLIFPPCSSHALWVSTEICTNVLLYRWKEWEWCAGNRERHCSSVTSECSYCTKRLATSRSRISRLARGVKVTSDSDTLSTWLQLLLDSDRLCKGSGCTLLVPVYEERKTQTNRTYETTTFTQPWLTVWLFSYSLLWS